MHSLLELHGQPGWVVALTPLLVDGMIVAGVEGDAAGSKRAAGLGVRPQRPSEITGFSSSPPRVPARRPLPREEATRHHRVGPRDTA
jgi:hypothetical protein